MHLKKPSLALLCAALLLASGAAAAASPGEARGLEELRNTVVNLLQGLVERGVLTREQAEQMVRDAQAKAASEAAAVAARDQAEESAVRVPYVPQVVKDEIRRQVEADLGSQVAKDVAETAKREGWGVPAALPEWVRNVRWYGDVRVRAQGDLFAEDNVTDAYRNFQRINEAGGQVRAGEAAFANVSEDRERLRTRVRFGFEASPGEGWTAGAQLATGSLQDPISTNQTLGDSGFRQSVGMDLAYVGWAGAAGDHSFGFTGGRMRTPFFMASELVYDRDLNFDGLAPYYRAGLWGDAPAQQYAYLTIGAFPLQEVELSTQDKWLFAGQLGFDWKYAGGGRTQFGASYHRFRNISGRRNALGSDLLDFTAPAYLRQGNTLFDIRNDDDPTTNLYALAADYELVDVSLAQELRVGNAHRVALTAEYVRNIGYSQARMQARTGFTVPGRVTGYQGEVGFGSASMDRAHAWRAALGYRYLQRDAVLDGYTDSDFRLGGTDVKGYTLTFDYSFTPRVQARARYINGSEIDGPPLGIDVLQLDLTASF